MRATAIGLSILAGLIPAAAQAQIALKQDSAYCTATLTPAPGMRTFVYTHFKLADDALVRTETAFTTSYEPESKAAGSSLMPITSGALVESVGTAGGEPANLTHLLRFRAAIGSNLGVLTVRFVWNGAVVFEAAPRGDAYEGRASGEAEVTLRNELPRALLKDGRGRLDVTVVSTRQPEPLFQLSYTLNGFGVTDWQRSAAGQPDVDATGVRIDGVLPAKCK